MKRMVGFGMALFCCFWLRLPAASITYVDDFTDGASNNIKTYSNLAFYSLDADSGTLPDRTAFSFAATDRPIGTATYRAQNAQWVAVGFYTQKGSFIWPNQGDGWSWILGGDDSPSGAYSNSRVQASFSESKGAAYGQVNGSLGKAHYSDLGVFPLLLPDHPGYGGDQDPPGDLRGYGVNAYASANGQSWSRINLGYTQLAYSSNARCYEEMRGAVPAGTRYVQVELNDMGGVYLSYQQGGYYPKKPKTLNLIASVTLEGEDLVMGVPEPVVPESSDSREGDLSALLAALDRLGDQVSRSAASSSSSKAASSSKSAASAPKSSTSAAGGKAGASVPQSQSQPQAQVSKFEGVIQSSPKEEAKQSSPPSSAGEQQAPSPSQEEESRYQQQVDPAIYRIDGKKDDDNYFTAGITIYIIVVTGVLALMALKSTAPKK